MADTFVIASICSYGIAAVGYALFGLRLTLGARGGTRSSRLFLGAIAATALWAVLSIPASLWTSRETILIAAIADTGRYFVWLAFLWSFLGGSRPSRRSSRTPGDERAWLPGWAWVPLVVVLLASVAASGWGGHADATDLLGGKAEYIVRLALAIVGLFLSEQLVRRFSRQGQWAIRPLAIALAGVFGFDLFLYADATLFGRLDRDIWIARGLANALVIPLLAIAAARNTAWTSDIHLSRTAVFRSTALLASGGFLLAIAGAGYFVRFFGGDWGRALQIEFLFAASIAALLLASSGRVRAKLKVLISKHFFSYRYDYREEWLRFTRTLGAEVSMQTVHQRTIVALADLVESPAGGMWIKDSRGFIPVARWNLPVVDAVEPTTSPLVAFLESTGWVLRVDEFRSAPDRYPGVELPAWLASFPSPWLIIPLVSGTELLAIVVLSQPRTAIEVDWEVLDLLKTASRQAASYLGHARAVDALLEARKFESFNRMSAFVVHDLKNLVAQLSLMSRNAVRHRANPEFQRDMLETVGHVVERMNGLLLQLRSGTDPVENVRPVDLEPFIRTICASKPEFRGRWNLDLSPGVAALAHGERLEHVLGHLLQNAVDATGEAGSITVKLSEASGFAVIEISDDGPGMTPEFMQERLFKPFQTTKASGMGIGVYESLQYVNGVGGQMHYDSAPGSGTRVRVSLPAAFDSARRLATISETA